MPSGGLSIVLHAHLPFVRHPEYPDFLEERWFFEAMTECYIPLIGLLQRLAADRVPGRLALSISPALGAMMSDPLLLQRYARHLERVIDLADAEARRAPADPAWQRAARFHADFYRATHRRFRDDLRGDVRSAFRSLQTAGRLEVFTTAATHAFLPLLKSQPASIGAQIAIAADFVRAHFGSPGGFWLPECGYFPGLEKAVAAQGFRWFIADAHGLLHADPVPPAGIHAPMACPNGVAVFARDPDVSRPVWSAHEGYPGDFDHREFHRDLCHVRTPAELGRCAIDGKITAPTGLKLWRVTGREQKEFYDPHRAAAKARVHARHYVETVQAHLQRIQPGCTQPPLAVAPFDAELFGHWWFEGPVFLEEVFRCAAASGLRLATPSDELDVRAPASTGTPSASSWGWEGYSACWISERNAWIQPQVQQASRLMTVLASSYAAEPADTVRARALNQAARSLLIAQASDWPFLIHGRTAEVYATRRVKEQLARFHELARCAVSGRIDVTQLRALELMDNLFPNLDYRRWSGTVGREGGEFMDQIAG